MDSILSDMCILVTDTGNALVDLHYHKTGQSFALSGIAITHDWLTEAHSRTHTNLAK